MKPSSILTSAQDATLLPCPFCGTETVVCCFGLGATYLVECQGCETSGPRAPDKPTAIECWNMRVSPSANPDVGLPTADDVRGIIPRSTPAQDDMILIPKAALDWLFGQGPDEKGWHFGDCREAQKAMNTKNPRRYWWRSKFRKMCNYPADTRLKIED